MYPITPPRPLNAPPSPITPSPSPRATIIDVSGLAPVDRLTLLVSGVLHICDKYGRLVPESPEEYKTTVISGKVLCIDEAGDMVIQDDLDLEDPHYIDKSFFDGLCPDWIESWIGLRVDFKYGPMVRIPKH